MPRSATAATWPTWARSSPMGAARAVVTATGMNTELGAHRRDDPDRGAEPTPLRSGWTSSAEGWRSLRPGARGLIFAAGPAARRGSCSDDVPDRRQHGRGRRSGGAARRGDHRAGAGRPAHAEAPRADPQAARRRDAGLGDRHLLRQDRHADREPHDRDRAGRGRAPARPGSEHLRTAGPALQQAGRRAARR